MITVTYDETKFAIVPIEPTELMVNAGEYYANGATVIYVAMIAAAPPYTESNFVESLDSWIPASDRLPENDLLVLIFTDNNDIITGSYNSVDYGGCWRIGNSSIIWHHNFNPDKIEIKWMPLPSAPKEPE